MGACLEINENTIQYRSIRPIIRIQWDFDDDDENDICVGLPQNVRVIQLAVSLGGVDSLISNPASMTHGPMIMTQEERDENGIGDGQIRLR